jgi:hypothetical protein
MLYIVTAHRWGWLNHDMYHVWAGEDRARAEEVAAAEVIGRGDKYGCQVLLCKEADDEMQFERVAYFPSLYHEPEPYHNPIISMHENLGRLVIDAFERGRILTADPDNPIYAKFIEVGPLPQWLADEVRQAFALVEKAQAERHAGE